MASTEHNNIAEQSSTANPASSTSATQPSADFKVWRPPKAGLSALPQSGDIPDSYFEPTTSEIMALQNSRVAARERLVDGPLKTSVIREREERQREAKYPTTRIRVKFPDQTQLERVFPSTDKIRSVYAFVRNSLREDVKPIKFILYQTPPRRELKVSDPEVRDKTLFQLQLAPSSVLMLSFFEESLNHGHVPAPLDPSVLAEAQDLPAPPKFEVPAPAAESEKPKAGGSLGSNLGEVKIPKWLKVGKK